MTRILVVGHTYMLPFSQAKWVDPIFTKSGIAIALAVPRDFHHLFYHYKAEKHFDIDAERFFTIKSKFNRSHMLQYYNIIELIQTVRTFRPDIIHIEADPYSVIGMEMFAVKVFASRSSLLTFFTWDNLGRQPPFIKGYLKRLITKYVFDRTEIVICGNKDSENILRNIKGHRGRTAVIPQVGVYDTPEIRSKRKKRNQAHPDRKIQIGYVGRLVPEKGIENLYKAFCAIKHLDVELIIVGNGPLSHEINTNWRTTLGTKLIVKPAVPHNEVANEIGDIDIFVLPSISTTTWREQFGLTLVIAMLTGAACVGSSSGAIPFVIGKSGIIFDERDVDALTRALRSLATESSERIRLGDDAAERARALFTHEAISSQYAQAFNQIISSRGRAARLVDAK